MLILGRQIDGMWALSDGAGHLIGCFPSHEAAQRRARFEQARSPELAIATSAGVRHPESTVDAH